MTLSVLASLKGAPGTTTLACLVAATWPFDRRVVVAECDPSGGDLASRFELSTAKGCLSFARDASLDPAASVLDDHVQRLPGGLEVLVGEPIVEVMSARSGMEVDAGVHRALLRLSAHLDVVVDAGRLVPPYDACRSLLEAADVVGVVIGSDAVSLAHASDQHQLLNELCGGRVSLLVMGRGPYRVRDIEALTGIRVTAQLPYDPAAAAVASGVSSNVRRLARSPLVISARRIATAFASPTGRGSTPAYGKPPPLVPVGPDGPFDDEDSVGRPR